MKTISLWDKTPLALENEETPVIEYYPAKKKTHDGCVVIFPGGGYTHRAVHEGKGYAEFLNDHGFDAFVCEYRIHPYRYPCALLDARRAVRYVRSHAAEFGINPNKVAVMGSSAGGNLAALLCTCDRSFPEETGDAVDAFPFMPDAQILCYPYVSFADPKLRLDWCSKELFDEEHWGLCEELTPEDHILDSTPQAFFFHTFMDNCVHIEHSLKYAARLRDKGIPCEMHIFPAGPHGLGLANDEQHNNPHAAQWGELMINWLSFIGF